MLWGGLLVIACWTVIQLTKHAHVSMLVLGLVYLIRYASSLSLLEVLWGECENAKKNATYM